MTKRNILTPMIIAAVFAFIFMAWPPETTTKDSRSTDLDRGKELYIDHCSKCHRKSGKGIRRIYPPVKNADYIKNGDAEELLRGMLFGRSGKIVVNGVTYNGVMTTEVDESLTDKDIALILTYVYQELNGMVKIVSEEDVEKARKAGKLPDHE